MNLDSFSFPEREPSPLLIREAHGDETLYYLLLAREAAIDQLASPEVIEGVVVDRVDPETQEFFTLLQGLIKLRKLSRGIDTLEE